MSTNGPGVPPEQSPERTSVFRADFLVENKLIIELKAVEHLLPAHESQLLNYLKATGIKLGLLLNFGPKAQIKRRVL